MNDEVSKKMVKDIGEDDLEYQLMGPHYYQLDPNEQTIQ